MLGEQLRPLILGDQPVAGNRDAVHDGRCACGIGGPFLEIDCAGKRRQQHELRERDVRLFRKRDRRFERVESIAGQSEDERPEDVNPIPPKRAQPVDERIAREVEAFVNVFQAGRGHRLHADQRAANVRLAHGLQELRVFGGFHRDLRVEDQIVRQPRELRHKGETLLPQRLELAQPRRIGPPARSRQIVERHRIEVIVSERDEPEPETPQLDDFLHDAIDGSLPRLLPVGAPHRAERTMLRAAAHGLHRCPHVSIFGKQIPPCGHEVVAAHAAAVIDRRRSTVDAVADDVPPDEIAVAAHHRMGAAEF